MSAPADPETAAAGTPRGRVLCLGEPLVVLTPTGSITTTESLHVGVGGAELNVAVHLARLGIDVGYVGAVGRDPFGERIRRALEVEGVDTSLLVDGDGATGLYFKEPGRTVYYRTGSAGSRLSAVSDVALAGAELVHTTGVTTALAGAIASTAARLFVPDRTWRVSYDVNHRPALWPPEQAGPALRERAREADVVLVGRDEAEAIWSTGDREEILALLGGSRMTELVIKDGPGAVEIWADGRWHRSRPPAVEADAIVEVVGAGDAFAAAYLAQRLAGRDPVVAAAAGHRLAAEVMARVGDH